MAQPAARPTLGPLRWATIALSEAKGYEPFAQFCCGHCAVDPSALEVNSEAARLYCGGPPMMGGPHVGAAIRLLDENDDLMGFAGMQMQAEELGGGSFIRGMCSRMPHMESLCRSGSGRRGYK